MLLLMTGGFEYITDPLNQYLLAYSDTFTGIGDTLLQSTTGGIMILYLLVYGWGMQALLRFMSRYLVRLVVCNSILAYYNRPLPFGLKLHQVPSEVCDSLVSYLDMTRLDAMFRFFKDYLASLNVPGIDWALRPLVWIGETGITMYQALLWAAIPVSYEAVSVLTLFLPLFVFTLMLPGMSHMFWNCLSAIWQAAFYRVIAAGIAFCAATSTLSFMAQELHGDYSIELFVAVLPKMCGLMVAWLLAFMVIGHLTSDLFKGTSSAGNGFGGMLSRIL
jgi:hypothetical protein